MRTVANHLWIDDIADIWRLYNHPLVNDIDSDCDLEITFTFVDVNWGFERSIYLWNQVYRH